MQPYGFGKSGTFNDVIEKLGYLADLGINCIELMPDKEFHRLDRGECVKVYIKK